MKATRYVDNKGDIIRDYKSGLLLAEITERYGGSRQGLWKALKRWGVWDPNRKNVELTCPWCGEVFRRCRAYASVRYRNYCSQGCYFEYIKNLGG